MISQLLIGSLIIAVTTIFHAAFIEAGIAGLTHFGRRLTATPSYRTKTAMLVAATLWLLASHSVGVWLWAFMFILLRAIDGLEPAVYFSLVTFTTLGYGDITLDENWRLLSALCAANGLLLFGFSTAFLVELMRRLRQELAAVPENSSS
ncbi:MAG: ion channel [Geminicoccaceae bacterium]